MALFSERHGFESKLPLQVDTLEKPLRNRLWSVFEIAFFGRWSETQTNFPISTSFADEVMQEMRALWLNFLKQPNDRYPGAREFMKTLRASVLD